MALVVSYTVFSVRITKMLMGAEFASEASEKNFFPAPPEGAGKVIS